MLHHYASSAVGSTHPGVRRPCSPHGTARPIWASVSCWRPPPCWAAAAIRPLPASPCSGGSDSSPDSRQARRASSRSRRDASSSHGSPTARSPRTRSSRSRRAGLGGPAAAGADVRLGRGVPASHRPDQPGGRHRVPGGPGEREPGVGRHAAHHPDHLDVHGGGLERRVGEISGPSPPSSRATPSRSPRRRTTAREPRSPARRSRGARSTPRSRPSPIRRWAGWRVSRAAPRASWPSCSPVPPTRWACR
jgi:hypothetical protein